jgi:hypothetical protein
MLKLDIQKLKWILLRGARPWLDRAFTGQA